MGFLSGVVTGLALAAGAAVWYMSRSGERFRDQYQVDRKLGELGDELEVRTREIQSTVNAQIAEMRAKGSDAAATTGDATLDAARASAAEAAAELAADVEDKAGQGQEVRQGRRFRIAVAGGRPPARAVVGGEDLRPGATLARMCDGSHGSTSTLRGRPCRRANAKTESHVPAGQDLQPTRTRHRVAD